MSTVMSTPASPQPAAVRPDKELLTGWLLLLLDRGATYGYKLRRELDAEGLDTDPGTVYRVLRRLERDGLVQSRWMGSVAGPRRRFYRLTAKGRRMLSEIAELITTVRDSHDAFVRAYAHASEPGAHDAGDIDDETGDVGDDPSAVGEDADDAAEETGEVVEATAAEVADQERSPS
jgi:PadR family transcriptional regulator, regulatory protein PadR